MTVVYSVTAYFGDEAREQFFASARPAFGDFETKVARAKEINSKSGNGASTIILAAYDLKDEDSDPITFLVDALNRTGFSHTVIDLDRWEARLDLGLGEDKEDGE